MMADPVCSGTTPHRSCEESRQSGNLAATTWIPPIILMVGSSSASALTPCGHDPCLVLHSLPFLLHRPLALPRRSSACCFTVSGSPSSHFSTNFIRVSQLTPHLWVHCMLMGARGRERLMKTERLLQRDVARNAATQNWHARAAARVLVLASGLLRPKRS